MIDAGKKNILGVMVSAVDYESAVARIVAAAEEGRAFGVTALAVHGVVTGFQDRIHRYRLNSMDLITPDGQPLRWVLNLKYAAGLEERVYGPTLTLRVLEAAARKKLPVFFYGSRPEVVEALARRLKEKYPGLEIAGAVASRFRSLSQEEKAELVGQIRRSGARILFVGLGCPRQEVFVYEYREELRIPVFAVGAAFDYHAGFAKEPPMWVQRAGLQWLHRLMGDPKRLWRRYLYLNTIFVGSILLQVTGILHPLATDGIRPEIDLLYG
jgi:N-acetylglucosaminyldiphosphoundecaprenol N-acetyl-beta-D-mannosaminyltransferase